MIEELTYDELYNSMCEKYEEITNNPIENYTDVSMRFKALAAELYDMSSKISFISKQIFPDTATGEYIDRHCQLKNIERKSAAHAKGKLKFFVDKPLPYNVSIPKGTICTTSGPENLQYATDYSVNLYNGKTEILADATAVNAGSASNCAVGAITAIVNPPPGITSVVNPQPFTGGANEESDDNLKKRLLRKIKNFSNGYNKSAILEEVLSFENVAKAQIVPLARGAGTVDINVAMKGNAEDNLTLAHIEEKLYSILPFCLSIFTRLVLKTPVDLSLRVFVNDGCNKEYVKGLVRSAVEEYMDGLDIGESIYANILGSKLLNIDNVKNYEFCGCGDIQIDNGCIAVLGNLDITVGSWEE